MKKRNQARWFNYILPLLLVVMVLGILQVRAATTRVECENMSVGGPYARKITSPFSGVALYANNDYCAYTQYFAYSTHNFSIRGCSNNSNTAQVVLRIGGTTVGTFSFTGTTPTVKTLSNISHGTGNQEIRLTLTSDNGTWDAYVDYLEISDAGSTSTPTPTTARVTPTPTRQGSTPTPTQRVNTPTPTTGTITIPPYSALPTISKLPDPFMFMSGSRMTGKSQWPARRAEISALAQAFEYGTKPPVPANVTGSYSNNRITVNVTEAGKSISFSCSITYPSTGTAPYPAIIGVGGSSLNNSAILSLGVAIINFPNDEIAAQSGTGSRGQGKFYTIYGSSHSAGALIAWAWGVDCLITALEKTPAANINPAKLGVTGCSRNGKGALACGAFNERIALTIPQEPGAGGAASWRISDYSKANGANVQTLAQIVTENCWFTSSFSQFSNTAVKLPFDQHSIMGLCAPRALLVIENTIDWLSPYSAWNSANAAYMIYEGLGIPDYMGFSQYAHTSSHCSFPSAQQAEVTAFIQRFLLGQSVNTTCMKNAGYAFEPSRWIDWTVPVLQ